MSVKISYNNDVDDFIALRRDFLYVSRASLA